MDFSERTREIYEDLFDNGNGEGDVTAAERNLSKNWGWYTSFYALVKGDIRAFEAVGKFPITQAFTFLTFETHKQKAETAAIKKRMNQQR